MIERKDVLSFNYYTYGQAFSGSDNGKRYRIIKITKEEAKEGCEPEKVNLFQVHIWKEPFSFEKTLAEEMTEKTFAFSQEGLEAAVDFINETLVI